MKILPGLFRGGGVPLVRLFLLKCLVPQYTIFKFRMCHFSGMLRKVNSVIIQRCSTTRLVNEPHNAYSIRVGYV